MFTTLKPGGCARLGADERINAQVPETRPGSRLTMDAARERPRLEHPERAMQLRFAIWFSTLLFIFILARCSQDSSPLSPEQGRWVSGIQFTYSMSGRQYTLPHDNRIYESTHFLVFSDASSDDVKIQTSHMAETAFEQLMQAFDISSSSALGIVDRDSKLKIYANRHSSHISSHVFAYGFVLFSLDSPGGVQTEHYDRVVKHELMHVFQHLFGLGLNGYDDWPEVWFGEGVAEFVSGGVLPVITSQSAVNEWFAHEDHVNPISIHGFQDYPVPLARIGEYYPMFELAVRYFLDERGHGKALSDVRLIYEALDNGDTFTEAFERYMGMSVDTYEESFRGLMSEFL